MISYFNENQIIAEGLETMDILVGDDIFIACPKTGKYMFTTIN